MLRTLNTLRNALEAAERLEAHAARHRAVLAFSALAHLVHRADPQAETFTVASSAGCAALVAPRLAPRAQADADELTLHLTGANAAIWHESAQMPEERYNHWTALIEPLLSDPPDLHDPVGARCPRTCRLWPAWDSAIAEPYDVPCLACGAPVDTACNAGCASGLTPARP